MSALKSIFLSLAAVLLGTAAPPAHAASAASTVLPAPDTTGGKPLMQALKLRHSSREFSPEPVPLNVLANLLWAANGVNRPETGYRTAPSAKSWHEIDVYVASADGLYLYDAMAHALKLVVAQDLRARTGRQDFVAAAPINLVYVADYDRMDLLTSKEEKQFYAAADAGFVAQNVYLFCASQGLATVVRGWVDKETLAKPMSLRPNQHVVLAQTVGYPRK